MNAKPQYNRLVARVALGLAGIVTILWGIVASLFCPLSLAAWALGAWRIWRALSRP